MSRGETTSETADQARYFGRDYVDFDSSSSDAGWMVSYADMMTIIVTFLILLLSVSTIAQTKFDMLVEALTGRKIGNLHKVKKKIDTVVERASLGGQVTTSIDEDGLKVQFSNALLFPSGKAQLTEKGEEVFTPISEHLVNDLQPEYGVTIEGYTDDVPIENGDFSSNWELSTSRAIHVMRRLTRGGFDRRRMSVQGFADTRSATDIDLHDEEKVKTLSDEKLAEVRAKNRRVVLRINRLDEDVVRDILGPKARSGEQKGAGEDDEEPAPGDGLLAPVGSGGSKEGEANGASSEEAPESKPEKPSKIEMFDSNSNDE